jgi:hypothetical protein
LLYQQLARIVEDEKRKRPMQYTLAFMAPGLAQVPKVPVGGIH